MPRHLPYRRSVQLGAATLIAVVSLAHLIIVRPATAAVSVVTGRYEYSWKDIGFGDDDPLTFRRAYLSVDKSDGSLGKGWTHSFDVKLTGVNDHPEGDRMFVDAAGLQSIFVMRPDGTFEPDQYRRATLEQEPPKAEIPDLIRMFVVTHEDGTRYRFWPGGRPYQITYPGKETVSVNHDARGLLLSVSSGKRKLNFAYSEDGSRLLSVTDGLPEPRRVTYEFDELGRLASVTNRLGHVTRYTYEGETSHLHEIIDARGNVAITLEYDADGRVLKQQNLRALQEGKAITFAYTLLDGGKRETVMVYPPSTFAPDFPTTVTYTYDEQAHTFTRQTVTAPGDEPVVEIEGATPRQIARSGGKTAEPTSGTRLTEVTLSGLPSTVTLKVGAQLPGAVSATARPDRTPIQIVETLRVRAAEQSTDAVGRLTGVVIAPGADRMAGEWRIEYDDEGRIVELVQNNGTEQRSTYRYDEVGNLVEIAAADGNVRQFEYDDRDSLVGFKDNAGATWRYEYDVRDRLSRTTMTPADGGPAHTVELAHDALGRLRLVRDLTDPAAPVETELQYDLSTLVGIWRH